jgi:hypothetical protein
MIKTQEQLVVGSQEKQLNMGHKGFAVDNSTHLIVTGNTRMTDLPNKPDLEDIIYGLAESTLKDNNI